MKYAVVTTGGKQYKVFEGDIITVDRLPVEAETQYTFPEVLLFAGDAVKVGSPLLPEVTVIGKVIEHTKGEKIQISKFKAKAKYRRKTGFRASLTRIQIDSISVRSEKKEIESASAKKATAKH